MLKMLKESHNRSVGNNRDAVEDKLEVCSKLQESFLRLTQTQQLYVSLDGLIRQ